MAGPQRRVVRPGGPGRRRRTAWRSCSPGSSPTFGADIDAGRAAGSAAALPPAARRAAATLEAQGRQIFVAGRLLARGARRPRASPPTTSPATAWASGPRRVRRPSSSPPTTPTASSTACEPGALEVPGVVYLALGCGADVAAEVIADLDGMAVSPRQLPAPVGRVRPERPGGRCARPLRRAQGRGPGDAVPLGLPLAGLRPLRRPAAPLWDRMPLQPATTPLWSATTCERYPDDPDAVRALAVEHLVEPVRFRELIERLTPTACGCSCSSAWAAWSAFVDDTLGKRPHLAVPAHTAKRPASTSWPASPPPCGSRASVDVASSPPAPLPLRAAGRRRGALPAPGRDRRGATGCDLQLGTPMVRLPESVRLDVPAPVGGRRAGRGPRRRPTAQPAALASAARRAAVRGARRPPRRSPGLARRPDRRARTPPTTPAAGRPRQATGRDAPEPAARERSPRPRRHRGFPWLVDHCFYRQARRLAGPRPTGSRWSRPPG